MKITLPITALAAILGLALAGVPVSAQTDTATTPASTTAPATPPAKAKKLKYSGPLTAIDTTANTITVTEPKAAAPMTVTITSTTKIVKDGKVATLADFKVGDKVSGGYTVDASGQMAATTLSGGTKPAGKKKAKAPATTTAAPATPAAQ